MHFICTTYGSSGDVHPMLALALALRDRGHRVTLATNGYFRDLAERFGVDFFELGTGEEFVELANHPDLWNPLRGFAYIYRKGIEPTLRSHYQFLAEQYEPGQTAVVGSCLVFAARIAEEKLGVPLTTIHLQPAVIWSKSAPPSLPGLFGPRWLKAIQYGIGERLAIDRVVCPSLNAFRAELGLAPIRRITRWWHSPRQTIGLFPEWFAPPQADWPANTSLTDFPLWDERQGEHLPDDVERFLAAGEPPLAFTPGSANVFGANFFRAAAEASRQLNRRAILLTRFAEQLPAELPERVVHFPYVPFSQLLPRAAATIHHGGVGSTAQGFAAATPQLLMPLAHDQFDNAERVRRLGVGDSLPAKAFTAERLAKKLSGILASDSVARACREVASRLKNRDGAARAAEMIERQASK